MLRLLSIEFHKFKYNSASKILTLIYFALLTSIALVAAIKFDIGVKVPYVWEIKNTHIC